MALLMNMMVTLMSHHDIDSDLNHLQHQHSRTPWLMTMVAITRRPHRHTLDMHPHHHEHHLMHHNQLMWYKCQCPRVHHSLQCPDTRDHDRQALLPNPVKNLRFPLLMEIFICLLSHRWPWILQLPRCINLMTSRQRPFSSDGLASICRRPFPLVPFATGE